MCNIADCKCGCQEGAECTCPKETAEDKAECECKECDCKCECGK